MKYFEILPKLGFGLTFVETIWKDCASVEVSARLNCGTSIGIGYILRLNPRMKTDYVLVSSNHNFTSSSNVLKAKEEDYIFNYD